MINKKKLKLSDYIIPSVISMVLVGTYTNIDGFFIGNVLGDNGLAAINFAWPIVALITSLGTGIGVGGSVILNQYRGACENDGAERIKTSIIYLLGLVGLLSIFIFLLLSKPILLLSGAQGVVLEYALDYSVIISIGALFQIFGSGLIALLRNEKRTYLSMICCVVGLITHLVLDFLLCEKYTLKGVAFSTVISQAVIMILCFLGLKFKLRAKIVLKEVKSILLASTSPLGINFVPSLVLLFTNLFAQKVGGVAAVSAYTVMSYAVYTFDYIFQGVCDGVQPVVSFSNGANDKNSEKHALKVAGITIGICSLVFICLTPALNTILPSLFKVSNTAEKMMVVGFWIYAIAYPFKAFVKFIGSYYYAINKTKISNLLIYSDPLVFTPLFLIVLPALGLGINGIWLSMTFSQVAVSLIALIYLLKTRK